MVDGMTETAMIVDWLKHHTLDDMRDLARELAENGENVSDIVDVINELEEISEHEGVALEQAA